MNLITPSQSAVWIFQGNSFLPLGQLEMVVAIRHCPLFLLSDLSIYSLNLFGHVYMGYKLNIELLFSLKNAVDSISIIMNDCYLLRKGQMETEIHMN